MKISIINGPNLNLIGVRETSIYGDTSMHAFIDAIRLKYSNEEITYFQSNVEGEIINELQQQGFTSDAIILNAGGYTHTSVAIADAVKAIDCKVIEVHISNIFAREEFRRHSFLSPVCVGVISGFGLKGYELAIQSLLE
ncbi:MAG TPA: type II 3-dehydroquinate dehydratase [Chitinophagaceae bacterium]|nr:type II 3-dehydroquinate dehydratase [Chitinophagaceae bacterium]